ncbi:triple tyrosine motif-containing protein [Tenuifilum thalassicum]|uniref:HTH luxR-type domain-containing protein n=1 Tax=Tenuifilum thalassicum TaxID=2590900 RepID=A0A7D4BFG4_9BACT|nr:triple tyrosine motif-containing protein [Tenuifilum thalassicum]QKG80678.1 hypothetical protein FHG85_10500 [Tenuifilum thalassicum]
MRRFAFIVFAFLGLELHSQINTVGLPVIKHFQKSEYGGGTQNWSIDQDKRGFIYIANNRGVLRFDGQRWNLFQLPKEQLVRSVLCSGDTIYVGAFEEIGYFTYDAKQDLVYNTLTPNISELDKNFDEAWRIYRIGSSIVFQTFTHVIVLNNGKVNSYKAPEALQFSFIIDTAFYVQSKDGSIYRFREGEFYPYDDKGVFNGKQIWASFKLTNGNTFFATINHGVWVYDGEKFMPWRGKANEFLKQYQIFSAAQIKGGYIAFGTIQNGLVITDEQGNLVRFINKSLGLQNNTVLSTFVDADNNLWLGLDKGIDYVELNSSLGFIGEGLGLEGVVYASIIFANKIFVGTNQGLYYADWPLRSSFDEGKPFRLLPQTKGQVWSLFESRGKLYCGHNFGTFVIDKNLNVSQISSVEGSWCFLPLRNYPNKLIVGKYNGMHLYEFSNGEWKHDRMIAGFNESSRIIAEDDNESIWVAHGYKGVFKIILNQQKDSARFVSLYDDTRGFPERIGVNVERVGNQILFLTLKGIYRYNSLTDKMEPYHELNSIIGDVTGIRRMVEDSKGNIWVVRFDEVLKLKRNEDGTRVAEATPLNRFGRSFVSSFENIYVDNSGLVFVGTEDGLACYNSQFSSTPDSKQRNCLIKSVSTLGKKNRLVFNDYSVASTKRIEIPFSENSIRVEVAAPVYSAGTISFRFLVKGYSNGWTDWTEQPVIDFNRLPYGNYELKVQAKDAMGRIYYSDPLSIQVLIPWYLSWHAFVLYLVILVLGLIVVRVLVRRRVRMATEKIKEQKDIELKIQEEAHKRQVLEAESEIMRLKAENLQNQVEHKNRELASIALHIAHKNEFLSKLKQRLEVISKAINPVSQKEVLELIRNIDSDLKMDNEWERFEYHFDEVHGNFLKRLKEMYPDLTPNELRLSAYLRLNMTTKDIAQILNISVRGVEISRYRLRKKLKIDSDTNLVDFMLNL